MSLISTISDLTISFISILIPIGSRGEVGTLGFHLAGVLDIAIMATILLIIISIDLAIFVVWLERKLMARMMTRRGPTHIGPYGLFQNLADSIKLAGKELITPSKADPFGFYIAVFLMVVTAAVTVFVLPWSNNFLVTAPNAGFLLIFAIFSIFPIAVLVAGWASNNKYSLIGGFRSAAQLISYEIPMVLGVLGVLILVNWNLSPGDRTFSFIAIANYQNKGALWLALLLPIGLVVTFTVLLGETERVPFDLPEAESELVMGWRTEYSAGAFLLIMAIEYFHVFINSGILVILFFGGWYMPDNIFGLFPGLFNFFDPAIWFFIKVHLIIVVMIWIRAALPRVRIDQFLTLGWTRLIPLAVLNLFWAIALGFLLNSNASPNDLSYLVAVVIIVVTIILFVLAILTTGGKEKTLAKTTSSRSSLNM